MHGGRQGALGLLWPVGSRTEDLEDRISGTPGCRPGENDRVRTVRRGKGEAGEEQEVIRIE